MRRGLLTVIALSFCFVVTAPAFAQVTEKNILIKKLFDLMDVKGHQERLLASSLGEIDKLLTKLVEPQETAKMTEDEAARQRLLEEYGKRVSTKFKARFQQRVNLAALSEKIMILAYDQHFTTAEIKDLIAFYETPTGQKVAKSSSVLMENAWGKMEEAITPLIKQTLDEVTEEEKGLLEPLRSGEDWAKYMKSQRATKPTQKTKQKKR